MTDFVAQLVEQLCSKRLDTSAIPVEVDVIFNFRNFVMVICILILMTLVAILIDKTSSKSTNMVSSSLDEIDSNSMITILQFSSFPDLMSNHRFINKRFYQLSDYKSGHKYALRLWINAMLHSVEKNSWIFDYDLCSRMYILNNNLCPSLQCVMLLEYLKVSQSMYLYKDINCDYDKPRQERTYEFEGKPMGFILGRRTKNGKLWIEGVRSLSVAQQYGIQPLWNIVQVNGLTDTSSIASILCSSFDGPFNITFSVPSAVNHQITRHKMCVLSNYESHMFDLLDFINNNDNKKYVIQCIDMMVQLRDDIANGNNCTTLHRIIKYCSLFHALYATLFIMEFVVNEWITNGYIQDVKCRNTLLDLSLLTRCKPKEEAIVIQDDDWEALYREMMSSFISTHEVNCATWARSNIQAIIQIAYSRIGRQCTS
eukprot:186981_1